eukprot:TRINITY_DN4529_c1_g1_i1.p2 TRINITY_DN4529_c1_g1~~TRINITY_DN4529_c1_g1_i1.p2  ORF type:complete len:543 (+),score=121.12 TRINITY_DN4529_c1_g1_i1:2714-4342(+)
MGNLSKVLLGVIGSGAGIATAAGYADEGVGRSQSYWSRAFPIYLRYRYVQFLHRDLGLIDTADADARYEALHDKESEKAKALCLEMRGFYLKNAQMMASREDFLPRQYIKWMKETEDQAPTPFEEGDAERIIEEQLGKKIDEIFSFFDPIPTGVASIGQVHRAILPDGTEVAVKIQHNEAEHLFRGDIRTMKNFCAWFMPQHVPAFDEIEKQFLTEFNYIEEAKNLDLIRNQIMPKWGDKVAIPKPYTELCSRKVLTMEYLHGVKLVNGIKDNFKKIADKMGTTLEELEEEQRRKLNSGELQLRSIENETRASNKIKMFLRCKDYVLNLFRLLANTTTLPYLLTGSHLQMEWSHIPINMGEVMGILMGVHGDQLLEHGCLNGDPHPGNILLLNDGRLGLIDFGQVKKLEPDEKSAVAQIICQIVDKDEDGLLETFKAIGAKTRYGKKDICYKTACFWFDRDTEDVLTVDGKLNNIAEFLDAVEAADPVEQLPSLIIMPGRMLILLRGLGLAFGMRICTSTMLEPQARQLLNEHPFVLPTGSS